MKKRKTKKSLNNKQGPTTPITVRQFEALIRISEAFARMTLSTEVTDAHVEQSIQLFDISINQTENIEVTKTLYDQGDKKNKLMHIISFIRQNISVKQIKSESRLVKEVSRISKVDTLDIFSALDIMRKNSDIIYMNGRRNVKRLK